MFRASFSLHEPNPTIKSKFPLDLVIASEDGHGVREVLTAKQAYLAVCGEFYV